MIDQGAPSEPGRVDGWSFVMDGASFRCLVLDRREAGVPGGLGEAEREIVEGILRGWTNARIAASRGTSVRTVANQIAAVFRKLEVSSRYELIRVVAEARG